MLLFLLFFVIQRFHRTPPIMIIGRARHQPTDPVQATSNLCDRLKRHSSLVNNNTISLTISPSSLVNNKTNLNRWLFLLFLIPGLVLFWPFLVVDVVDGKEGTSECIWQQWLNLVLVSFPSGYLQGGDISWHLNVFIFTGDSSSCRVTSASQLVSFALQPSCDDRITSLTLPFQAALPLQTGTRAKRITSRCTSKSSTKYFSDSTGPFYHDHAAVIL